MWEIHIQHEGLRASRVLHGPTQADAQSKATSQLLRWDARWSALQCAEAARNYLLTRQRLALHGHSIAARLTADAIAHRRALDTLLATSLHRGRFLHWHALKDTTPFADPAILPTPPRTPPPLLLQQVYTAELTLLDRLLPSRRAKKERTAGERFARDLAAWQVACRDGNRFDAQTHTLRQQDHTHRSASHRSAQLAQHARIDDTEAAFNTHEKQAVEYFFAELLSRSDYPPGLPEDITLQYIRSTRTLIVDYELPSLDAWPTHRQVLYNPNRNSLHEVLVSAEGRRASYDSALFQIALRVLHELFLHDDARALDRIAFNGRVRSVDKATGNLTLACVLTILVPRAAFTAINLAQVDPRACFLKLKGRASSHPTDLAPVKPVLTLIRETDPFLDLEPTLEVPETPFDLASMTRSDFEALVREAFERELRKNRSHIALASAPHDPSHDAVV